MFKKSWIILSLIVVLGLFLRNLNFKETFMYAHDGDLTSWIIKDIVFDKHIRLIGQETSAPGVFIGPLYYYSLIPFYYLANWDPIGGIYFALIISALTIVSFYFVFTKIFDRTTGLIAAFVQAALCFSVSIDRWVVPTILSGLWTIWFFYCLLNVLEGRYKFFILLGILAGLIWHINFTLAPLYLLVLLAIFLRKKIPSIKILLISITAFLITSIPFLTFEIRHNFSQTITILTYSDTGVPASLFDRLNLIFIKISGNISTLFFYPYRSDGYLNYLAFLLILGVIFGLYKRGLIKKNMLIVFFSWIGIMFLVFASIKKPISEYYFHNLNIVFITLLIILLAYIFKKLRFGKIILLVIFLLMTFRTFYYFYLNQNFDNKGYANRKELVQYIKSEKERNNFPCISISYLTLPGEDVGFRYLFYLNKIHVNQPKSESPNFTIVSPPELSFDSVRFTSGRFGVIPPDKKYTEEQIKESCSGQNSNLTDPMMGFISNF